MISDKEIYEFGYWKVFRRVVRTTFTGPLGMLIDDMQACWEPFKALLLHLLWIVCYIGILLAYPILIFVIPILMKWDVKKRLEKRKREIYNPYNRSERDMQ